MADQSGSDSSLDTSSSQSNATPTPSPDSPTNGGHKTHISMYANDDGDASDASMSADSDDSDDDDVSNIPQQVPQLNTTHSKPSTPAQLSLKRKLSPDIGGYSQVGRTTQSEQSKKVKTTDGLKTFGISGGHLQADRSLISAEIWHHIFTFVPPRSLGRLLRVNKTFNACLNDSSKFKYPLVPPLAKSATQMRKAEAIWQASRRLYHPRMPNPLPEMTELAMWRLVCSISCEKCHKENPALSGSPLSDAWHSGPASDGVRPIWLFGIRSCGSCLMQYSVKEIDLLLSSSVPSPLLAAAPFIFLTQELHVVSATTISQSQQPANVQMAKHYLRSGIESLRQEFFKVKALGTGTAEEWLKGLEARGKLQRDNAARWERFETAGGILRMRESQPAELGAVISKSSVIPVTTAASISVSQSRYPSNGPRVRPQSTPAYVLPAAPVFASSFPPRYDQHVQIQTHGTPSVQYPPRSFQPARQERTREEVLELKAARKAEIERRCSELDPPITPGVLSHMASFQAALQIVKPFDDSAWSLLMPRLLTQRADAEKREDQQLAHARAIQAQLEDKEKQEQEAKNQMLSLEQEWERVQLPLKNRIASYATEIIHQNWADGSLVTAVNCAKFAAGVLVYVRRRFYDDLSKEDAIARAQGVEPQLDPVEGPYSRQLTLENMRWIFETKIKPHTELYGMNLFQCNGCSDQKAYSCDGVVQHFAAEHTRGFSPGINVVNWRAEWPENPPFNPEFGADDGSATIVSEGGRSFAAEGGTHDQPKGYMNSHGTPASGPVYSSMPQQQELQQRPSQYSTGYYEAPSSFYGQQAFSNQYTAPQAVQYGHAVAPRSGNYATEQYSSVQGNPYHPQQQEAAPLYPEQAYQGRTQDSQFSEAKALPSERGISAAEQFGPLFPNGQNAAEVFGPEHPVQVSGKQAPTTKSAGIIRTEEYRSQLSEVARSANSTWKSTGGISGLKDIPGSVRVFVILHHILKDFNQRYDCDPPLSMIIDGLNYDKEMRPVRNINGLACRACALEKAYRDNSHTRLPKGAQVQDKKLLSFPQLLNHFQSVHIGSTEGPPQYNWTSDMVELPEKRRIASLAQASSIEAATMDLVKDALPNSFIMTPPPVDYAEPEMSFQVYEKNSQTHTNDELPPSKDNHEKYYTSVGNSDPAPIVDGFHIQPSSRGSEKRARSPTTGNMPHPQRSKPSTTEGREYPSDDYLEGPRYYQTGANLSELLGNPALHNPVAETDDLTVPLSTIPDLNREPQSGTERFLDNFVPGESQRDYSRKAGRRKRQAASSKGTRADFGNDAGGSSVKNDTRTRPQPNALVYEAEALSSNRWEEHNRQPAITSTRDTYEIPPHPQRQVVYEYEEPYAPSRVHRGSLDYPYAQEEIIYVDEQGRRVPPPTTRYIRYETAPHDAGRARSRSPIYNEPPVRYIPQDRVFPSEPVYRRSPGGRLHEILYDSMPRQEYYQAAREEPYGRQQQPYIERIQYVQADGLEANYMSRSQERQDQGPVYTTYEEGHPRGYQVAYPSRGGSVRPEAVYEDEEYDPRNPAPLTQTAGRQNRYQ